MYGPLLDEVFFALSIVSYRILHMPGEVFMGLQSDIRIIIYDTYE